MPREIPAAQAGITLIETVFVIAIVAVLCSTSLPALGGLMRDQQSRSAHNALVAALNLARGSGAASGITTSICPSHDAAHCDAASAWHHGWIVFRDRNGDGERNDSEQIIQVHGELSGVRIASSTGRKHVSFRADGASPGTNLTFSFCDATGHAADMTVVVSNSGRIRAGRANAASAAACSAAP